MKIHFLSTIGVDYDLDLAPYWIKYYQERKFDTYTVFLHKETGIIPESVKDLYRNAGFNVRCIDGPYSGGKAGAFYMENFIKNLPVEDFVTVADADEFQAMPDGTPVPYSELCGKYDILHGLFEERYADNLSECVKDPFEQYPHIEPYTGNYFNFFSPPYLDHIEWPCVYRCKIIAARAIEAYRYWGMHTVRELNNRAKILFGLKVIHFNWREGAARKMAKKEWLDHIHITDPLKNEVVQLSKKDLVELFT